MNSHEIDTGNMLFLLGGHDLEMLTIRDVLKTQGIVYVDHDLRWGNALLSSYRDEIADARQEGKDIYGIELRGDMPLPERYHSIDHHNEFYQLTSSIEQVMELLLLPMDKHQKLVAANDKAYIPGMLQMGATEEEISEIRRADKRAQGVTKEEEQLSAAAVNNRHCIGDLIVVKSSSPRFSPICDRLYPYKRLLIYTCSEWCYFGQGARQVYELFRGKKGIYRGGGDDGYVGTAAGFYSTEQIDEMKELIISKARTVYSYHIFYFPFKWDNLNFNRLPEGNEYWERVSSTLPESKSVAQAAPEEKELFNEKQYYFKFVHHLLYDEKADKHPIIRHYERKDLRDKDIRYNIAIDGEEYRLKVDSLNLNLYSTGVGILTFFLQNDMHSREEDILNINQYGRRIMPPNVHEIEDPGKSLVPKSITLEGLDKDYSFEPGNWKLSETWKPAPLITTLIEDLDAGVKVSPIIDDRMLVNCWYGNDDLSKVAGSGDGGNLINSDFWYKYVFVDNPEEATCRNEDMKKNLLRASTYTRWQKSGTLYGVSPYSFVALTDSGSFAKDVLSVHMRTIYSRMFEIVLVQRASVLRFSGEVTRVSHLYRDEGERKAIEDIEHLYEEYIRFVNQIYFTYVTAQDQGIELYDMMMKQNSLSEKVKDLDGEISELYQYAGLRMDREDLRMDREKNENSAKLNRIAAIFLPITLIISILACFAGLLGMNDMKFCLLVEVVVVIVLSGVICAILYKFKGKMVNGLEKCMDQLLKINKEEINPTNRQPGKTLPN